MVTTTISTMVVTTTTTGGGCHGGGGNVGIDMMLVMVIMGRDDDDENVECSSDFTEMLNIFQVIFFLLFIDYSITILLLYHPILLLNLNHCQ